MSNRLAVRLGRLINLVPYFMANPGISAAAAAAELGVSKDAVIEDLNQLWMCGLPGYGPGDLIDLSFSEDSIEVTYSAGIDRPLRLTSTEATALLIALRSLVEMPGPVDPMAANRAIAKIETAAGASGADTEVGRTGAAAESVSETPAVAAVRSAVTSGQALHITYYSASRDAVTERTVDPIRLVLIDGHSYLQAWCRSADGVRLFRLDRIDRADELDEPSAPPEDLAEDDALDLFRDDTALPTATLVIAADHAWLLDYYPMTERSRRPDGSIEVSMRFATVDWMARLVVGLGHGVAVDGPPDLVEAVGRRARAALAMYAEFTVPS